MLWLEPKSREALCLLKQTSFRRLVLLGDIFCELNFARLNQEHWRFLSHHGRTRSRAVDIVARPPEPV